MRSRPTRRLGPAGRPAALRLLLAAAMLCAGCGEIVEKVPARPRQSRSDSANFALEVDPMMRGTVASETVVVGLNPVVVRGYGLVVGLQGTGGRLMPAEVRAAMLQELSRRGVGNPSSSPEGWTPARLLDSPNTAVVVVEGVIPPGASKGSKFDLRVSALPGSDVTSLEGGRLYTTDLRPGPLLVGSRQAKIIGRAKGNIFINPFVEPGATRSDAVNRLVGRVLDGGETTDDIPLKLKLATSSHTRARTIQSAINSVFPRETRQKAETARGENADSIALTVPPSYKDRSEEFIQLMMHVPLDITASETTALAVRRALIANPGSAESAMWRFRAIGKRAIPVIQDLYGYPEEDPRMAALRAGAALDDPLVVRPLLAMAATGSTDNRVLAIDLLADMGFNPDIDLGLRPFLVDNDVDVRLAAYETLTKRRDPLITRLNVDGKFDLAIVPSNKPLVYVAQSGRPTIAVFDDDLAIDRPLTMSVWSNRLLMKADHGDDQVQVYFRPSAEVNPEIQLASPRLAEFIPFLGHTTTVEKPFPGLGLSYGETIGAIHQIWRAGYLKADFKAEQDRVLAAILRSQREDERLTRPEFEPDPEPAAPEFLGAGAGASSGGSSDLASVRPPVDLPPPGGDTVPR